MTTGGTSFDAMSVVTTDTITGSLSTLDISTIENISTQQLYESILRVAIIDYRIEPRFRKPIVVPINPILGNATGSQLQLPSSTSSSFYSGGSSNSNSLNIPNVSNGNSNRRSSIMMTGHSGAKHLNKFFRSSENEGSTKLTDSALKNLDKLLYEVTLNTTNQAIPELTRKSFINFYNSFKKTQAVQKEELKSPYFLVILYTKTVNQTAPSLQLPKNTNIAKFVNLEVIMFISKLKECNYNERNYDTIAEILDNISYGLSTQTTSYDTMKSPDLTSSIKSNDPNDINNNGDSVTYIEPPCGLAEMHMAQYVGQLFNKDKVTLQNDINRLKTAAIESALQEDLKKLLVSLKQDNGIFTPIDFSNQEAYNYWKDLEDRNLSTLLKKLTRPVGMKKQKLPANKVGFFYVIPDDTREYFVKFLEICLKFNRLMDTFFSNKTLELVHQVATFWRIDDITKTCLIFAASNNTIVNITTPFRGDIIGIDLEKIKMVLGSVLNFIKDEKLKDLDNMQELWPEQNIKEWANNIMLIYLQIMNAIKKEMGNALNETSLPGFDKFFKILQILNFDPTFEKFVENSPLPKKWEKKISRTLEKAISEKYIEIILKVPTDSSTGIIHIYQVTEKIINILELTSKRFRTPFMGFLNITQKVAFEFTSGFSRDAEKITYHIINNLKNNAIKENVNLNLPDTLLISYDDLKSLHEEFSFIEESYNRVNPYPKRSFNFKYEKLFFPFLEKFIVIKSREVSQLIKNAFSKDNFEDFFMIFDDNTKEDFDDNKCVTKSSISVKDCISIISTNLRFIQDLDWHDEYQCNKLYTLLLKGISESIILYGYNCLENITNDINNEELDVNNSYYQDLIENVSIEESPDTSNAIKWFTEVKAAVQRTTSSNKIEPPKPYKFKTSTCILLNNIGALLENIDNIEKMINPESISAIIRKYEGEPKPANSYNLFSVKIVKAEDLKSFVDNNIIDSYVVLTDPATKTTIGKTRKILNINPIWNEEFELTVPAKNPGHVILNVWNSSINGKSHEIIGRAALHLDLGKYSDNGIPTERWMDLGGSSNSSSLGRILVCVSMESEKVDALFCIGRAHRSLVRARDRAITLIVNKFSSFIRFTFSRSNLRSICGNNGAMKPDKVSVESAIVPLGQYLNANFNVLGPTLARKIFMKVMLEAWSVIVENVDSLLLPPLNSAKYLINTKTNGIKNGSSAANIWQVASNTIAASFNGNLRRPLTSIEIEVVFEWLKILCVQFFYNKGEGPPLEQLQDARYRNLLFVTPYYDTNVPQLIEESQRLISVVNQYIKQKSNFYEIPENSTSSKAQAKVKLTRSGTIARSRTIMAQGSARARQQAKKDTKEANADPFMWQAEKEDIILRVLIAKGESQYVARRIQEREAVARITESQMLARAAAQGIRFS